VRLTQTIRRVGLRFNSCESLHERTARMMAVSVTAAKGGLFHAKRALRKALRLEMNEHVVIERYLRRDGCTGCI